MEGLGISSNQFLNPLKVKKVNIGSPKYPKFVNIGDYWDDEIIANITNLLHEFQYVFPMKSLNIKGIFGDLVEMKIHLKPDVKPIRQ